MKDLLQKLADLETTLDSMDPTPKEIKQLNEAANMSINMSGETADEVAQLVQIMRAGGTVRDDPQPMGPPDMGAMGGMGGMPDMGAMRDLVKMSPPPGIDVPSDMPDMPDMDKGKDGKDAIMGMDMEDDVDEGAMKQQMTDDAEGMDREAYCEKYMAQGMDREECEQHWDDMNETAVDEAGYDNSPEEDYKDHNYMTKDLSGGINREKKAYAAAQDGDNAMAVEELQSALRDALMTKMAEVDDDEEEEDLAADMDEGGSDVDMDCAHCDGAGKHGEDDCTECGGTGEAQATDEAETEGEAYSIKGKTAEADAELARIAELSGLPDNEAFREAKDSFDEAGCTKEMKRLDASGCSKNEMLKKVGAKFGCGKGKFEELYASSCGSH